MSIEIIYEVVKNHEEQYSVWPASKSIPEGWTSGIFQGTRDECLNKIGEVWTDMRPKSLRDALKKKQ